LEPKWERFEAVNEGFVAWLTDPVYVSNHVRFAAMQDPSGGLKWVECRPDTSGNVYVSNRSKGNFYDIRESDKLREDEPLLAIESCRQSAREVLDDLVLMHRDFATWRSKRIAGRR
jgi:hypothetical protein